MEPEEPEEGDAHEGAVEPWIGWTRGSVAAESCGDSL
jgi:hypothetical protein